MTTRTNHLNRVLRQGHPARSPKLQTAGTYSAASIHRLKVLAGLIDRAQAWSDQGGIPDSSQEARQAARLQEINAMLRKLPALADLAETFSPIVVQEIIDALRDCATVHADITRLQRAVNRVLR